MSENKFSRPPLDVAQTAWKECLESRGLPSEPLWIFSENLCIERLPNAPGGPSFGFQIRFTPPDAEALDLAYDHFCESDARIVFYRLGSFQKKSVCILLCDEWFEGKTEGEGFVRRDDWGISLRPGSAGELEEVTDLKRWVRRLKHDGAFHDFDFGMSLETIEEIRLHGRPLMPYERMAQKMLGRLRRMLGNPD